MSPDDWERAQEACTNGNLSLLQTLLSGATVIKDGQALYQEIISGSLASRETPSSEDSKRLYILMQSATASYDLDILRYLFNKYPATSFASKKPLIYYALGPSPHAASTVRFWIEKDPSCLNYKAKEGSLLISTLLFVKDKDACLSIAKVLLENGADVNEYVDENYGSWSNQTPLKTAVRFSFPEVVEMLEKHGARDAALWPLLAAVETNNVRMVKYLLDRGEDPNEKREKGTPLHAAAVLGIVELVEILLKHSADMNCEASVFGDFDMVDELISTYQDTKDQGFRDIGYGKVSGTPLHAAAIMGRTEVVKTLLNAGADVSSQNNEGLLAVELAEKYGRIDVIEILKGRVGH